MPISRNQTLVHVPGAGTDLLTHWLVHFPFQRFNLFGCQRNPIVIHEQTVAVEGLSFDLLFGRHSGHHDMATAFAWFNAMNDRILHNRLNEQPWNLLLHQLLRYSNFVG